MSVALPTPAAAGERLHSLDALRATALLLGVVLHAAMSFIPSPVLPLWIVADNQPTPVMAIAFFAIHLFRMATFFLIAGYFAQLLLERRGAWGFAKNRLVRIAGPLSVFWTPVFAGIIACVLWAVWLQNGHSFPPGPPPPPITVDNFPLTHLWFLWMLLILYAGLLLGRFLLGAFDRKGRLAAGADKATGLLATPLGLPLVAAPLTLGLYLKPDWFMWFGVPTPDKGLVPNPQALIAFGIAFLLGVLIRRNSDVLLAAIRRAWAVWTLLALVLGTVCLLLAGGPVPNLLVPPVQSLLNAAIYALAVYAAAFAGLALALRFLSGHRPAFRYLADASYWIYLVHLPIVMALQVLVHDLAWPWPVKVAFIVLATAAITLATYELLIRHSFMGRFLNGRKVPWRRRPDPALVPAAA